MNTIKIGEMGIKIQKRFFAVQEEFMFTTIMNINEAK